MMGLMREL